MCGGVSPFKATLAYVLDLTWHWKCLKCLHKASPAACPLRDWKKNLVINRSLIPKIRFILNFKPDLRARSLVTKDPILHAYIYAEHLVEFNILFAWNGHNFWKFPQKAYCFKDLDTWMSLWHPSVCGVLPYMYLATFYFLAFPSLLNLLWVWLWSSFLVFRDSIFLSLILCWGNIHSCDSECSVLFVPLTAPNWLTHFFSWSHSRKFLIVMVLCMSNWRPIEG